jgi:hypothetical protein
MRQSTSKFFMILSQALILFTIGCILTEDKQTAIFLSAGIGISFLFAYSGAILYPKLLNKFGENNYKTILIIQYGIIGQILYTVTELLETGGDYIGFMAQYIILCFVTYHINRKIYINEINALNRLIKKTK